MSMFNRQPVSQQNPIQSPRILAQQKYTKSRTNLLIITCITVVNIIMLLLGSDSIFLFSASIPYVAMFYGTMNSVRFMLPAIIVTVLIVGAYFTCWYFSKKNHVWLIAAFVLFIVDTVVMIMFYLNYNDLSSGVIDIIFHAWIVYYFVIGIVNGIKLKSLPADSGNGYETPAVHTLNGQPIDDNKDQM